MDQLPELAPTHLAVPVFIAVMLLELLIGRVYGNAKFEMRDTGLNLLTSFVAGTERVLSGVLYAFVLMYVYQYRVFDFEFSWMLVAIVFVADDLIYYIKHRIEHTVRWAWASHVVHHSSQHFNTSVALRQTWTYALTGLILLYIPLVLIGVHPALLGFCATKGSICIDGISLTINKQQHHIAQIDKEPGPLPKNKHRVSAMDGIDQQGHTPGQAEKPEGHRHHAAFRPLTGDPLHQKAGGEHQLPAQPDQHPPELHPCGDMKDIEQPFSHPESPLSALGFSSA